MAANRLGNCAPFKPVSIAGRNYSFDHLKALTLNVADGERLLRILINFSCHCFTEKFDGDMASAYRHGGELRRLSAERSALSRHLPGMIQAIADKKVFFTRETNYLTVELVDHDGASVRYTMFFDLKRAHDAAHDLVMTVESAYIKVALPRHLDKIRFSILARKVARGEKVRSPYHFQKRK